MLKNIHNPDLVPFVTMSSEPAIKPVIAGMTAFAIRHEITPIAKRAVEIDDDTVIVSGADIEAAIAAYIAAKDNEWLTVKPSPDLHEAMSVFVYEAMKDMLANPARYAEGLLAKTPAGQRFARCKSCWDEAEQVRPAQHPGIATIFDAFAEGQRAVASFSR